MEAKVIETLNELKKLAADENGCDCFILLAGGTLRSSKQINYYVEENRWIIYNSIDGTIDDVRGWNELKKVSNVPEALSKRALILDAR